MAKRKDLSIADINLRLVDCRRLLFDLTRELDQIPADSYEELKLVAGLKTPGYRSRAMVCEDIKLTEDEITALGQKKVELLTSQSRRAEEKGKSEPERVAEEYNRVVAQKAPGVKIVEDRILEDVAENLGKKFGATKQAYTRWKNLQK